jgi:hypothetical protein
VISIHEREVDAVHAHGAADDATAMRATLPSEEYKEKVVPTVNTHGLVVELCVSLFPAAS